MDKYRLMMLLYAFIFFSAAMTFIVIGSNLGYEVASARQEHPPTAQSTSWTVQKVTKGLPPIRIATRIESRQGTAENYTTSEKTEIHWSNIIGITAFSIFMSAVLVFIGGVIIAFVQKLTPQQKWSVRPNRKQTA